MPDWRELVAERLSLCELNGSQRDEVVELASHLEEIYDELSATGISEPQAASLALAEVKDWRVLARFNARSLRRSS